MYRFDPDHYLNSPQARRAQYGRRLMRRIMFHVDGIEPRAKHSMPPSDKREIQRQLLKQLVDRRRRPFQGLLALELNLATTERMPTHSHHIAKNLLDLLGETLPGLPTRRRSLLYRDDKPDPRPRRHVPPWRTCANDFLGCEATGIPVC